MKKIDHKKELKHFYSASTKKVDIVEVPEMNFLLIDGSGDPNTSKLYQDAVAALFGISYTLKFMIKKGKEQIDYSVMPLEGLWWMDDMTKFTTLNKDEWKWTMMIMQSQFITAKLVDYAIDEMLKKKKLVAYPNVRFEKFTEGKAAQIMHIGPFSEEGPTIQKVHDFISGNGFKLSGKHHEIYLSDIRKAKPEKWKTIVRQPFKK
jgi:hypothetical protein